MPYGVCKMCGCTDNDACFNPKVGNCWWVDGTHTLCSHCAEETIAKDPLTVHCFRTNLEENLRNCCDCIHMNTKDGVCELKRKKCNFESFLIKAIEVIGEKELIDRAIEELAELTVAISHYRRGRCVEDAVREEIADVMIACRQLEVIFGKFEVEDIRANKIRRFKQEIKKREER